MQLPGLEKRRKKRFNVPVIGHFADKSIRFKSILQAEQITEINYTLIFESCVGKILKARNVYWEFENRSDVVKYKTYYSNCAEEIKAQEGHH